MEVLQRMDYLIKRVFSKQNRPTFPHYSQEDHHRQTTLVSRAHETKPHVFTCIKRIVISVHLIPCFLISYTRLFTKLNLFEILFCGTFITTKFSRSTVYQLCGQK